MRKITFWKDRENEIIDPELFSRIAEEKAKEIGYEGKNVNKRSQLRKFYDEVVRLNMLSQTKPKQWAQIRPMVHMLSAKAAYAKGRKLISDSFLNFIKDCVEQVKDEKDLNMFASIFEAFMGFYAIHGPK